MALGATSTSIPVPNYSVLVVDDERDVREQLRLRFEMEGYRVFDADGGDQALAICHSVKPDLVVTDIRMSKGTGTELLKRIHEDGKTPVPIVLCITGHSDLRTHDAFEYGACAIFKKPFDMRDLMAASRRFLELREAEARAAQMLGRFERDLRSLVETTLQIGRGDAKLDTPMENLKEVTAMILHEINRPLSVIAMNSSLLVGALKESPPRVPAAVKMASNVEASCQKLVQISRSMRELFLRSRAERDAILSSEDLVRDAIRTLQDAGKLGKVQVNTLQPERTLRMRGSAQQVGQALLNLIENAVQAAQSVPHAAGAMPRVDVTVEERGDQIVIVVADNGPGVVAEDRARIFEPFFSTKGEKGTGMGLAVAAKVAEAHHGSLRLVPSPVGARFELSLPQVLRS